MKSSTTLHAKYIYASEVRARAGKIPQWDLKEGYVRSGVVFLRRRRLLRWKGWIVDWLLLEDLSVECYVRVAFLYININGTSTLTTFFFSNVNFKSCWIFILLLLFFQAHQSRKRYCYSGEWLRHYRYGPTHATGSEPSWVGQFYKGARWGIVSLHHRLLTL